MGGEGDLKAAPGGARERSTGRPRGARGSSLLSSHISPVWPVSYVWGAVGQRGGRGDGLEGRAAMGGEGDLKAMVSELKSIWPRFARHKT